MRMIANHKIHGMWKHLRCVYIDDTTAADAARAPGTTALQQLLSSHKERQELCRALQAELEASEEKSNVEMIEAIVRQMEVLRVDTAESRARVVLLGLGIDPEATVGTLSGGFLYRLALASALFLEVDVLLLDELTNQLDMEVQLWLQEYLANCSSTVVVVTHDSVFLDAVAEIIICFEDETLKYYDGNFSAFLRTRAQQLEKHRRMYIAQEARRKRMERTIEHLNKRAQGGDESSSRQIHSRKQQLKFRLGASMDGVYWKYGLMGPRPEILAPPNAEPFVFEMPTDLSDIPFDDSTDLLIAKQIGFAYEGSDGSRIATPLFDRLDLRIGLGTRLILLGPNGSGKSTLLRCLNGDLKLKRGTIMRWEGLRVGYHDQSGILQLTQESGQLTALQHLMRKHNLTSAKGEKTARSLLGSFGLIGTVAEEQPISVLSSGQRTRVLFASLAAAKPHLLLLDEPTNYLDQESHAAIVSAFQAFEGGIVAATHDQQFAESIGVEFLCLVPGQPTPMPVKGFDEYLKLSFHPPSEEPKATRSAPANTPSQGQGQAPERVRVSRPHPSTQEEVALAKQDARPITCRRCKGPHFTHQCPNPEPEQQPAPRPVHKLPTKVKATDGGADWTVAVSKSTRKRLERGQ